MLGLDSENSAFWDALGAIGQWFGAIATFLAAFIALRTARDAKQTYMIDQRPYVTFDNIELQFLKEENQIFCYPENLNNTKGFK